MAVYVSNIVVNAGVDFDQVFTLENVNNNSALNLTNYSVKAQMRKHAAATGVTTFTASVYDAATGKIKIGLSTTTTASLKPGRYVYDVVLTDASNIMSRVIEGMVLVREGVTR
jgi:hypothetical protein